MSNLNVTILYLYSVLATSKSLRTKKPHSYKPMYVRTFSYVGKDMIYCTKGKIHVSHRWTMTQ